MPPKQEAARAKGKKGKGRGKADKVKEYTLITLEEQQARELKYSNRLSDLKACLAFIDEAATAVHALKEAQRVQDKWDRYLRVDGLPKPYLPPEMRLFAEKLRHFEALDAEKTTDWLLSVNERSILSQDIFNKDMTRRVLIKELRPNFGAEYEKIIDYLIKALKNIDYYLDDTEQLSKSEYRILMDILEQKKVIHQEILKFFDRYTYRILSSEDSYMDDVDATTAEYFFKCDNFRIHIWTLKNVPILFDFLPDPFIIANFHNLDVELLLPFSILKENLTLRGIHFAFDHFSEHAKSYRQDIKVPTEHLTAGIPDLHECLIHEYLLQMRIQNDVRNQMLQKRAEYDEKVRLQMEMEEQKKKSTKNKDANVKEKKIRPIKLPKEPPIIPPDVFPDIWDDFLHKENGNYNNFIKSVYHPEKLNLVEHELNLKKYMILGGIYQFYFVEKPTHFQFSDFNMTWHEHDGELQTQKDVVVIDEHYNVLLAERMSQMSKISRIASTVGPLKAKAGDEEVDKLVPWYFLLTIQLPRHLCLWDEPEACHFEADLIAFMDEVPDDPTVKTPVSTTEGATESEAAIVTDTTATTQQSPTHTKVGAASGAAAETTDTLSIYSHSSFSSRLQRSANIFRPSATSFITSMSKPIAADTTTKVYDFRLDIPLTIVQIRNIQRHCLPRIISSFKFPSEVQDDFKEEMRNKPKGKGGMLLRKRQQVDQDDNQKSFSFKFEEQNNPERMYPLFPEPDDLRFGYILKRFFEQQSNEPETFSQLINVLDLMKGSYQDTTRDIMLVPPLKTKVNYQKLRRTIGIVHQPTYSLQFQDTPPKISQPMSSVPSLPSGHRLLRKGRSKSVTDFRSTEEVKKDRKEREERERMQREIEALRAQIGRATGDFGEEEFDSEESEYDGIEFQSSEWQQETPEDTRQTYTYSHWTKEHIFSQKYDKENCTITIETDRLGTIGLAFKRYEHFPFKNWTVEPSPDNPENEVVFMLETQYVLCVIYITANGYRGYVTESTKGFVRKRVMHLEIKEPITDFKELKKRFRERHLNIFSEHDARFYIENGYFSEKHLAVELHTYSCIALHCLMLKYARSGWNRLAQRRDIVLRFAHHREPIENLIQVRITPENATFVDVRELCSDDLNIFRLDYTLTWRNIDNYSDFHHLIMSCYLSANDYRCRDPKLIVNIKNILCEIRPLSYS